MIPFAATQEGDRELIELAFSKKKADDRKEWLRNFKPGTYLDHRLEEIPYSEFINKELILFSMADNIRSIPSVADGLKPGQRKVIWGCFKRKLKGEIKVCIHHDSSVATRLTMSMSRLPNLLVILVNTLLIIMANKVWLPLSLTWLKTSLVVTISTCSNHPVSTARATLVARTTLRLVTSSPNPCLSLALFATQQMTSFSTNRRTTILLSNPSSTCP